MFGNHPSRLARGMIAAARNVCRYDRGPFAGVRWFEMWAEAEGRKPETACVREQQGLR